MAKDRWNPRLAEALGNHLRACSPNQTEEHKSNALLLLVFLCVLLHVQYMLVLLLFNVAFLCLFPCASKHQPSSRCRVPLLFVSGAPACPGGAAAP